MTRFEIGGALTAVFAALALIGMVGGVRAWRATATTMSVSPQGAALGSARELGRTAASILGVTCIALSLR